MKKNPADASTESVAPVDRGPDEILPEYDPELIRHGVRGKYAARYAKGTNAVVFGKEGKGQ